MNVFTAPTDSVFPPAEDAELYAIEKAARVYKRGVERNQAGWRACHDRERQCPKWLRWLCWGFTPLPHPLPPPLPPPLSHRWEMIAKQKGWM